jgi:hypothetical protein
MDPGHYIFHLSQGHTFLDTPCVREFTPNNLSKNGRTLSNYSIPSTLGDCSKQIPA